MQKHFTDLQLCCKNMKLLFMMFVGNPVQYSVTSLIFSTFTSSSFVHLCKVQWVRSSLKKTFGSKLVRAPKCDLMEGSRSQHIESAKIDTSLLALLRSHYPYSNYITMSWNASVLLLFSEVIWTIKRCTPTPLETTGVYIFVIQKEVHTA